MLAHLRRQLGLLAETFLPDDLFDVELYDYDDGPDYQCACGRWLPCRHCHPVP